MATIATLAINIIGNTAALDAALSKAQASLRKTGDTLTGLGGKLTAGVSLPILGVGGAALKAAADNEQLQVAFSTMLGSAEKATTLMQDLSTFAAATPFESAEIQQAAKMLLAYGSSAENVTDEMRSLGDIAAGVGVPLQDIAYLYGTARVQGRLFTADINQFTTRGIPIIEALAETMGVAQNEIRGMVEEGKIGFPELQAALAYLTDDGGKFSGLMEAQSQTLSGLFSTLKDNVALSMIDIGNAIAQAFDLKTNAVTAIAFVERIRDTIADLSKNNPELLRLGVIITAVAAAVGPLVIGLGMFLKAAAALTPVINLLGGAMAFLLSPIGLLIGAVVALGVAFAADFMGIRTTVMSALEPLKPVFQGLYDVLILGQEPLGDWSYWWEQMSAVIGADAANIISDITEIASGIGSAIAAIAQGDWAGATAALNGLGESLNWLWSDLTAIDWGGALASLGESLNGLKDQVVASITAIDWGGALETAGGFLDGLRDGVVSAVQSIDWGGALETAADWLNGLKDGVIGAVTSIPWGEALAAAGEFLGGLTQGVIGAVQSIDWGGALETAGAWLESLKSNVVAAIQGIDWSGALTTAGNAFGALETAVAAGLSALGFTEAANGLNLATVTATLQEFVASVGAMGSDIQTKVEGIKIALQPLIDFLEPSFSRLGETVLGLPEKFGTLSEKFGPLAEAAGRLGDSLGGFTTIGAIVGVVLSLLANAANAALEALTPLAGAVIEQLTTVLSGLADIVSGLVTAFQGIVNNDPSLVLEGLTTAFGGVKDIVAGTFVSNLTLIQTALEGIGGLVSTTLSDWGFGAAATAVEGLVTNITSLLEKIKAIASGDTTINFAAPDWIVQLLEWLWPELDLPDWAESLLSWQWPELALPEILESLLGWKWPDFPSLPDWVSDLMDWAWPSFDMPDWLNDLFAFKWPSLPQLPSWLGGPSEENKAVGTSYFGGGFVNASEVAREVAILPCGRNWLPRGTQILNGRDSENFLAGVGGGGVTVIVQNATFRNERDMQRFAFEMDDIVQRRRRA